MAQRGHAVGVAVAALRHRDDGGVIAEDACDPLDALLVMCTAEAVRDDQCRATRGMRQVHGDERDAVRACQREGLGLRRKRDAVPADPFGPIGPIGKHVGHG